MFSPDGTLISASAAPHCGVVVTAVAVQVVVDEERSSIVVTAVAVQVVVDEDVVAKKIVSET